MTVQVTESTELLAKNMWRLEIYFVSTETCNLSSDLV